MLSLAHTIISLPFGVVLSNPIVAFVGAFFMHVVCDMMLHWNIYPQNFKRYPFGLVALDVLLGLLGSYILVGDGLFSLPILAAIAGGNMPDILHAGWSFMTKKQKDKVPAPFHAWFHFHEKVQWETMSPALGAIAQIVMICISIAIILLARHQLLQ